MMGQYEAFVGAYNKATTAFSSFCVNSAYFAPWLTVLIVGQTVLFDGKKVLEGKLGLSTFLSSISALKQLGAEFQTAYGLILRMNNAYASVAQLTVFLNLPVDVPDRRVATRRRRKEGKRQRALVREDVAKGVIKLNNEVPVDRLPIKVRKMRQPILPAIHALTFVFLLLLRRNCWTNPAYYLQLRATDTADSYIATK